MKKRILAATLSALMCLTAFTACKGDDSSSSTGNNSKTESTATGKKVTLNTVSQFSGDDANAKNYQNGLKAFQEKTGHTLLDASAVVSDEWKAQIINDFETGSEPDVIFYFTSSFGDPLVQGGKVMSIEDIRKEYPNYCSNISDGALESAKQSIDGKNYAIPVTGFWEGTFVNTDVLETAGVSYPTTWNDLIKACDTLKEKGITPFSISIGTEPHYFFEYMLYNFTGATHLDMPKDSNSANYQNWVDAIQGIADMYAAGYFTGNTLTATHAEAYQEFLDKKSAFLVDGAWRRNSIIESSLDANKVEVQAFPSRGTRDSSDMIGGYSSGWFITKKCWNDPDKRAAAVEFVEYMTSDDMLLTFNASGTGNPSKNPVAASNSITPFVQSILSCTGAAKAMVMPVQDVSMKNTASALLFQDLSKVCEKQMTAKELVDNVIAENNK